MFEIKYRDAMGRIGIFETNGKKLETPAVLPVINQRLQQVSIRDIENIGFKGIITNAYIIFKDEKLREQAIQTGIHNLLGYTGVIMTDSGSYQLYGYGSVEVSPTQIVEFQNKIGSDIGVILDIPTPPDVSRERAEADLKETIKRARDSLSIKSIPLAGTVQGSTYSDLREKSAREMGKLDFELYPIGGVVPLMEEYRFPELVKVIMHSKKFLPLDKPVHLFGCGHPMIFALAVALGCDLFDSAAYALYARDNRYITAEGTLRLGEIYEFPCSCEVCSNYEPRELLNSEEREQMLAKHNLHATLQEIKRVKQSIYEGSLWELVQKRARAHPSLLEGFKTALRYEFIERFDPVTKNSAFFYSGSESLKRPEVVRHLRKLKQIEFRAPRLVLVPNVEKPYSKTYSISSNEKYHICVVSPVFGVIPLEIEEVYPLNQHEAPNTVEREQIEFMKRSVREYSKDFKKVFVHKELKKLGIKGKYFKDTSIFGGEESVAVKLRAIADYQFGKGAGKVMFDDISVEWARTEKIRRIYSGVALLSTLRASDGVLIPTTEGARRLLKLPYPRNRVVMKEEVEDFVREGKSVFAKFIVACDPEIRPHQEVIAVNEEGDILATGTALLNSQEMLVFKKGVAVKVRHSALL